jgi:hypothetical protein
MTTEILLFEPVPEVSESSADSHHDLCPAAQQQQWFVEVGNHVHAFGHSGHLDPRVADTLCQHVADDDIDGVVLHHVFAVTWSILHPL